MRRDDLHIAVPSFFTCPISLDVMKSPVSLCTGITYDRSCIQRWLDGGNNTCPATMQVLHTKDYVPNLTLHHLIQSWSDSVRRRAALTRDEVTGDNSPESFSPTRDEVAVAIKVVKEGRDGLEMLSKILRFARQSEENREFLAGKEDCVPMLVDLVRQVGSGTCSSPTLLVIEEVVKILSIVRSKISDRERFSNLILSNGRDFLTAIVLLLKSSTVHPKVDGAAVLEFIAVDAKSKQLIAERDGLIPELIKSLNRDSDPSLIEASLSCLIAIASPKRVKLTLILENLATNLAKLLTDPATASVSVTEKCLKLLEVLACCKEGAAEICGGDAAACVEAVVKKLMKVSAAATEHAVTVLWSVCCVFKEKKAQEAVTRTNGVTKILLLLQSNCSPSVRQMLTDLLKDLKVHSRSCLSAYDTETTHIMPF